jgi:hypothetical protein
VRLVTAPRTGEAVDAHAKAAVSSTESAAAARAAEPGLTTGDTVLRAPQQLATQPTEPPAAKPRTQRRETRRQRGERRWTGRTYQVTSESGRRTTPIIVVRPLRLEAYR